MKNILLLIILFSYSIQSQQDNEISFYGDKINFENSLMSSNKENKNSSENNKDNNFKTDEVSILENDENNKDDNLNYLININA